MEVAAINFSQKRNAKIKTHRRNRSRKNKLILRAITSELYELLVRMAVEKYRHTGKYILAPEETMQRDTIARFMTKLFSHYHQQLNTGAN